MHVADGHGPVRDGPAQVLHWQLQRQTWHSVAGHQPIGLLSGMHGLGALDGALRPQLEHQPERIDHRNFVALRAMPWRQWHGRPRRVRVAAARRKCSFVSPVTFTVTPL